MISECWTDSCNLSEALCCIHISLLCLQHHPHDRPNMSSVVMMLGNEIGLPQPKLPAFLSYVYNSAQDKANFVLNHHISEAPRRLFSNLKPVIWWHYQVFTASDQCFLSWCFAVLGSLINTDIWYKLPSLVFVYFPTFFHWCFAWNFKFVTKLIIIDIRWSCQVWVLEFRDSPGICIPVPILIFINPLLNFFSLLNSPVCIVATIP